MINFLITFLLMLILGSIFILGFFTITRGKKVILPNGNEEIEKEIFGNWQLFWEHIKRYKKVYYSGEQLEFKLKLLEQLKPYELELNEGKKSLRFRNALNSKELRDISYTLNTKILMNGSSMFFYDEYHVYRFPTWVRKITNCYVCISSWMGTIIFATMKTLYPSLFNIFINPRIATILFWVVYLISLAFLNKIIKENLDNDKKELI